MMRYWKRRGYATGPRDLRTKVASKAVESFPYSCRLLLVLWGQGHWRWSDLFERKGRRRGGAKPS